MCSSFGTNSRLWVGYRSMMHDKSDNVLTVHTISEDAKSAKVCWFGSLIKHSQCEFCTACGKSFWWCAAPRLPNNHTGAYTCHGTAPATPGACAILHQEPVPDGEFHTKQSHSARLVHHLSGNSSREAQLNRVARWNIIDGRHQSVQSVKKCKGRYFCAILPKSGIIETRVCLCSCGGCYKLSRLPDTVSLQRSTWSTHRKVANLRCRSLHRGI